MMTVDVQGTQLDAENFVDVDMMSNEARQNWRELTKEFAGRAPFYFVSNGITYLVLGNYASHNEVFHGAGTDRFAKTRGTGADRFKVFREIPTITTMGPVEHARVRGAIQPVFNGRRVRTLDELIGLTADRLLDDVQERGEFDGVEDFGRHMIIEVLLKGLLGTRPEHIASYVALSKELPATALSGVETPTYTRSFNEVLAICDEMLATSTDEGDDFTTTLVRACHDGTISREEFVGHVLSVCAGGISSTAAATSMLMFHVAKYPEQFDEVRRDPSLVGAAVAEYLRSQPAGLILAPRYASEDTEIQGTYLPAGMPVLPSPPLANYDPAEFSDPWTFDIHRTPNNHLSFGRGIHMCLGIHVARRILTVTLPRFLDRFSSVEIAEPDFRPTYTGLYSEFLPLRVPLRVSA